MKQINLLFFTFVKYRYSRRYLHQPSVLVLIIANLMYFCVSTTVCFFHSQDMNLKYTQMKENYTSNIFFLTDQENETQSLSNKDESRKKNKQK